MLQESKEFFQNFFNLFPLHLHPDIHRHLHGKRKYAIGFPDQGSTMIDLEEIKNCIAKIVQQPEYSHQNIKPKWAILERSLQRQKESKKIISRKEVLNINSQLKEFALEKSEITELLLFLNRVGTVLYFDEDSLRETIILDLQWFVNAFKCITNYHVGLEQPNDERRKHFQFTGELDDKELNSLWKSCSTNGRDYFIYKKGILSYMEKLELLAICSSEKLDSSEHTWYYIPSMNRRRFDKKCEGFLKSSILCFEFKKEKQLPTFVFNGVVLRCCKIPEWKILEEEDYKCIYEKVACFDFRNHIVVLCICKFQIQVQVWDPSNKSIDMKICRKIKRSVEDILRQFKKCSYEVGYKCSNEVLNDENNNSFVKEELFPLSAFLCKTCKLKKKHYVRNEICWVGQNFLLRI